MMPPFSRCLVVMFLAVSCAKVHTPRGPLAAGEDFSIPERLKMQREYFVPVSDRDYLAGRAVLASLPNINRIRAHVLIPSNESDQARLKRLEEYERLTEPQKAAVGQILARCVVTDDPGPEESGVRRFASGSEINFVETLRTSGKGCPASLLKRLHTRWKVLQTDPQGETGSAQVQSNLTLLSAYLEPQIRDAANTIAMNVDVKLRGRMEISEQGSRTFAKLRGQGRAQLTNLWHGEVNFYFKGEFLERDWSDGEVVMYVDVESEGRISHFAFHATEQDGLLHVDQFFIGDRPITVAEMAALQVDEFVTRLREL